ncbi:MAG: SRPBCC family protein [Chloroflexi bacterium]|nr:MAG: SRPBCC family protein [Chloroflexota bacterium]
MRPIDERILLNVRPEDAWAVISDISRLPEWWIDCQQVAFLSSIRKGPGVRWRFTANNGRESIIETTAWYDRIGFEYTYIDGMPFHSSQGILRIQDTPDGTVIQWLFMYEIKGPFSGMRNALLRRKLENTMADSLQALGHLIKANRKGEAEEYRSAALMRDAPDVERRARWRHLEEGESLVIEEPAITEDDTRPRMPAIQDEAAEQSPSEPDFLEQVPEAINTASEKPVTASLREEKAVHTPKMSQSSAQAPDSGEDSGWKSVFEVFGLPKPSETAEMRAVSFEEAVPHKVDIRIRGLRYQLRKQLVKLKRE